MWLVTLCVARRAIFPSSFSFSYYFTRRFHAWFLSLSVLSFRFDLALWERPTVVEMENRLGLRCREKRRRDARAISRRQTHYAYLTSRALPKISGV